MVTTAIVSPWFLCVGCRPASGEAGPWRLLEAEPTPTLFWRARMWDRPGMQLRTPEVQGGDADARSQPANELREEVYTDSAGALSTAAPLCTDRPGRLAVPAVRRLNWPDAA